MIQVEKLYTVKLTEQQAKELYSLLQLQKDAGHMTTDHEIVLVYNELKQLFGSGIR